MAILEITGDFSTEKSKSDSRFDAVSAAITAIKGQIEVLNGAWQDDKSADFISALTTYTSDIETKLGTAKTNAEAVFTELYNCLKIYNSETN